MKKIKNIETKEEWLKLVLDGAKGVSNFTADDDYVYWNGYRFVYSTGLSAAVYLHTKGFGIIEEVEEVELFEYIYKDYDNDWVILGHLFTEEEAKVEFNYYEYRKTGRSFKVPKD